MKLLELFNNDAPLLKVWLKRRKGSAAQTLIVGNLNLENINGQIQNAIARITAKFMDDVTPFNVKLIDDNPVTFNIIAPNSDEYFQFHVAFPEGMDKERQEAIEFVKTVRPTPVAES